MLELLELTRATLVVASATLYMATAPAAIISGTDLPDIKPMLELMEPIEKDEETRIPETSEG